MKTQNNLKSMCNNSLVIISTFKIYIKKKFVKNIVNANFFPFSSFFSYLFYSLILLYLSNYLIIIVFNYIYNFINILF